MFDGARERCIRYALIFIDEIITRTELRLCQFQNGPNGRRRINIDLHRHTADDTIAEFQRGVRCGKGGIGLGD